MTPPEALCGAVGSPFVRVFYHPNQRAAAVLREANQACLVLGLARPSPR